MTNFKWREFDSKKGMDGLEDIEFDPIKLTQLQIVGDGGPISLNMTIDESVVKGYSTIVINTSEIVPSNQSWITSFYIPKILIEGYYRMHGRILVLPLVGSGNCSIEPSGINATAYMKTNFFENYGQIFYNVTEMTMDLHFSGMKLYLHNLFEGIKPLEEATNQALNDNWRELLDSFKTFVSKPIEDNFVFTFNKLLHYIPAKYIVSDIELPQVSTKN
ncbi:hypothetical protein Bhyg_00933 [Pseudolycoriella hygida]|uniref:Protein takeout n=1 Tax=Pseudolycoriella hygida TaxID=35572 RepID=A0A9Q0NAH1_9DIPT|nr:hypothetical protein Bhyg_00933 [Pseudolycoriella hygida]